MPQMAPINWLSLYFIFSVTFILFIIMDYYIFLYPPKPFLLIIATTSNIIRPETLAIRLTANMIAGHLLVTLLGNSGSNFNIYLINILIIVQILLLILESVVAIIQSYVFSVLATLYSSEVN